MKSLLVKFGIILLIGLTIFGYAEVWGADWKFFKVTRSSELVGGLPVYRLFQFYDASSIVYPSKNIVKVWIKSFEVERGKNDTFPPEIKELPYETLNPLKLDYTTYLLEIYCLERRYKSLKVFFFVGEDGVEKEVPKGLFPSLYESNEISPEDDMDILWKMLCK
jgi:hypothetical protein